MQAIDVKDLLDWMLGGVQDANFVVVVAMFSWHVYKTGATAGFAHAQQQKTIHVLCHHVCMHASIHVSIYGFVESVPI